VVDTETYLQLAAGIDAVSALCSARASVAATGSPSWGQHAELGQAYFGTTFLGAVAVPLLPIPREGDRQHPASPEPAALFVSASLEDA